MNDPQERQDGEERFFSVKQKEEKNVSIQSSLNQSNDSDTNQNRCLTLRIVQYLLPCLRRKGVWEPSQGDVFKSHDAEEAKYPRTLRILESRVFDIIFVSSCLLSIYLFLFSEGFLIESRLLWGVIHLVNAVYAMGLFSQWLQILIKSKYAKTNHGYTTKDIVYTLLSVFPADLIVLAIYTLNDDDDNDDEATNPIEHWMITISRLNYFLRIRNILQYFSKWEDQLVVGDFRMFIIRTFLFSTFLLHVVACIWHRLACQSFRLKHFLMTPDEATTEVCRSTSWLGFLKSKKQAPLLEHDDWHVLITHYCVSLYWSIIACFRLGASDIHTSLITDEELAFVVITQIGAWIYMLANVSGTLTSLLIEKDTERENFLTRCFAIRHYLSFGKVARSVEENITTFYRYLWNKRRGILNLDLVEVMPPAMKSEVFYDVNKFVLDQLPMLKGLETPFLMSLSIYTNHKFYLSREILFKKNETATAMYYVVKGYLEVLSDDERHTIATIRSGSVIGEIHLLHPYPHVATVRCGTDCDILVLARKHFKRVLNIYPQYVATLEQRLENRLEQSGLLLALCEKHNTYHKAFKALREFSEQEKIAVNSPSRRSQIAHSFENVTKILDSTEVYEDIQANRGSDDFDGLNLTSDVESRVNRQTATEKLENKCYAELLQAAYGALEADVARAGSLASDLNIPRPPLIVMAPDDTSAEILPGKKRTDSRQLLSHCLKILKEPTKGQLDFVWNGLVAVCALIAFWYYPYQFAFREVSHLPYDYAAHLMDVIFALDFVYDMMQIIVTPHKTFESNKEILIYRLKSIYFYVRLISFIPFEYMFVPIVGSGASLSPIFYLFKFNRLLQIHLVFSFFTNFETRSGLPPIVIFMAKFALALFFVSHTFTVLYMFVMRDLNQNPTTYLHAFYWATVVTTSTGYGDLAANTDAEVVVETLGLIVGVSNFVYMTARVTSILVNTERRRLSFKHNYYGLQSFMQHRRFPKSLCARISNYFKLQWRIHEGTLTPSGRPVIWDAPKSLVSTVAYAHAHKYVSKIPLFMNLPKDLENKICVALRHYIVPPEMVLLYPGELARDLYIIAKGFCEVVYQGKRVGVFSEGRYFGLNGLLRGVNTEFKFKTITHCQIFCLSYENFSKVANGNPHFFHEFRLLTGEKDASQLITPSETEQKGVLLPYPSLEFITELVKNSPVEKVAVNEEMDAGEKFNSFFKNVSSCLKNLFENFYLLPNGEGLRWWMIFRVTIAVCATISAPALLAFSAPPRVGFIVTLLFDIVAWIDIIISMRIAYFGQEHQLVTNSGQMALHYIKGPFLIDILGCIPLDLIAYLCLFGKKNYGNMYHVVSLLRLNRMLQCYKLFLCGRLLKTSIYKSLTFLMLLEMIPLMFVFINVTTCLSVLPVCGVSQNGKPIKCQKRAWIIQGMHKLDYTNSTLVPTLNVLKDSIRTYVIGLYWVTQTVLCLGFGDITIGLDQTNQIIAILVIFIGIIVVAFADGKLVSCIVGDDPVRGEMQEKMRLISEYLEQHRVSKSARRRVHETFLNAWDKTKGFSPTDLFIALPSTLRTDVMKQLYEPALRSSPLFQDLDGPALRMLCSALKEIFYPEGEFLMKFGDLSNEIFFIAQGAVVCYNVRGDIMSQMGSGSLIGEIAAFFHTHRLYTAIAVKDVNAYVFQKDCFMSFLAMYPEIKQAMEAFSIQHYKEAMMGSKKVGNVDFEVLLTFQNEIGGGHRPVSVDNASTTENTSNVYAGGDIVAAIRRSKSERGSESTHTKDLTRIVLKDDLLKNAEDYTKATTEKWWSVFVTFGRMARDEMGLVHIYQEMGQCTLFNFTIHPASSACSWVSFCLVLTAMSCSITAYEIAFSTGTRTSEETPLLVIRYLLEFFFVIRFIGNFHLGYYDEGASLITSVKTISKRYISKVDGMWLDLLSTFPFYLFADFIPTVKGEYVRSLQLLRVFLFVRYLHESDADLKMKASRVKVLKITILICFIFHFWACAWYLIACYEVSCSRGSWMHKTMLDLELRGKKPPDVTVASRYLLSLYYVTTTLTLTGFSEITAKTNAELCMTIAMMFATMFVIGYLVGEMTQCLTSQVATKIHYQHTLSVLESHFTTLGLSYAKIAEVRQYFRLLWCRCKGMNVYDLMEDLPYPLRADIAMEIYGPNLKSSRILGKLDENILRQISAKIRHEIYFPGSHIVRAGDVCVSMYFIKKGEVVILDGNSNLELCVEVLYENECFGEVKLLLPREQYRFSYIARLESEVGVLDKEDLEAVLRNHSKIFEELKDKANKVKSRRQSIKEDEDKGNLHGPTSSTSSIKSGTSRVSASSHKQATPTK